MAFEKTILEYKQQKASMPMQLGKSVHVLPLQAPSSKNEDVVIIPFHIVGSDSEAPQVASILKNEAENDILEIQTLESAQLSLRNLIISRHSGKAEAMKEILKDIVQI